jgi:hypothetical protein
MSFFDKLKNKGLKTRCQAEIKLLERECNTRKKKFGVDLYDSLTVDKKKMLNVVAGTIFKGKQEEVKEPFERAKDDIAGVQAKKDIKNKELAVLEAHGSHTLPDYSVGDKAKKAGRAITDAGKEAKIKAELALLDREIKIRKEQFGLEVYAMTSASDEGDKKGVKGAVKNALANLSEQEKEIQQIIDEAKADVALVEGKITSKQREINLLDDEMNQDIM